MYGACDRGSTAYTAGPVLAAPPLPPCSTCWQRCWVAVAQLHLISAVGTKHRCCLVSPPRPEGHGGCGWIPCDQHAATRAPVGHPGDPPRTLTPALTQVVGTAVPLNTQTQHTNSTNTAGCRPACSSWQPPPVADGAASRFLVPATWGHPAQGTAGTTHPHTRQGAAMAWHTRGTTASTFASVQSWLGGNS
jgi:hypothetical protein